MAFLTYSDYQSSRTEWIVCIFPVALTTVILLIYCLLSLFIYLLVLAKMLICSTVIPIHPQGNMNICISCKTQMSGEGSQVITIHPLGAMDVGITILQNGRQTKMK